MSDPTTNSGTTAKSVPSPRDPHLRALANCICFLTMDAVQKANSGHPGAPMGLADVATVLFKEFIQFDASDPHWIDRDRLVLSNGHASMLLYSLLYLTGYSDMTLDELKRFRQVGSKTPGHPEYSHADGIELTTGPLGQGIADSVGMALAERVMNANFGDDLVDHYTYVFLGDGCLMEGISHEAISLAGHLRLGRLIAFWDNNSISIDGATKLAVSDNEIERFHSAGWHVLEIDGHDTDAIRRAIETARTTNDRPTLIACRTIIGFGFPTKAGTEKAHSDAPGEDEIAGARQTLDWHSPPFEIPDDLLKAWREVGARGRDARLAWEERVRRAPQALRTEFERRNAGKLPDDWKQAIAAARQAFIASGREMATRKASGEVLDRLFDVIPELLGGSADLTVSNNTKTKNQIAIEPGRFKGSYLHYGVREHGMAAAMNGIALHGGLIPYGGTFLCFSDYCRPAIRLSAMMRVRSIFVMTHDSIGLGEDGPTHQPVEHLAALRAIPQLAVYRPADPVETAECWELILEQPRRAALLALSRQPVPLLRNEPGNENKSARGAYILREADGGPRQLTLLATGSEVDLAVQARDVLQHEGVPTAVVSMPCRLLFEEQPRDYQRAVLGTSPARVAVEAAVELGWERYIGPEGRFVGMHSFGESGKIKDVYDKFDITVDAVVRAAHQVLSEV
ncbi:transketolase [Burkholderia sp. HI2761]|uniref:transketolase n=1 Tax=Burkholderia TaxID=32008 RepID=UPI000422827A|nr:MULTISPECIES: transketolase [Burkholderia]MPV59990.1 transketolase [Burkholderia sp. BE24]OXJ21893.1 transketolase [Burkholderia sp. HI2761]